MRKILSSAIGLAMLGGCAGSGFTAASVQQACVAALPVLSAAASSASPGAAVTASYGNAFCGPVLAGGMPPTANANSASWVLGLVSALAPVVIGAL